jgi:hypothetical protein
MGKISGDDFTASVQGDAPLRDELFLKHSSA